MTTTVRLRITGRVQAVGYRAWAMGVAARTGLRGWVRNRTDGSVELLATGREEDIARLIEACRRGPATARVADVVINTAADDGSAGFDARPTA